MNIQISYDILISELLIAVVMAYTPLIWMFQRKTKGTKFGKGFERLVLAPVSFLGASKNSKPYDWAKFWGATIVLSFVFGDQEPQLKSDVNGVRPTHPPNIY